MKLRKLSIYAVILSTIFLCRFLDSQTFEKTKRLTFTPGDSLSPSIAVDSSDHLHAVWADNSPDLVHLEIYYKKSTDGGASWTAKRLTRNPKVSYAPTITVISSF
jgi:hypothetical protein